MPIVYKWIVKLLQFLLVHSIHLIHAIPPISTVQVIGFSVESFTDLKKLKLLTDGQLNLTIFRHFRTFNVHAVCVIHVRPRISQKYLNVVE